MISPIKKIKDFFTPTTDVRFRDVVREVGITIKTMGQDIARNIASAGVSISRAVAPKELKPYVEDVSATDFFKPVQGFVSSIFRDEPIKSIEQRIAEAEPKVKEWGVKLKENNPKNSGLWEVGSFIEKNPYSLAFVGIMGSVGLDLTPFGGLQKNAVKSIKNAKTVPQALSVLKKMGVADDIARTLADDVVKAVDDKVIIKLFDKIMDGQRIVKPPLSEPRIKPSPKQAEMPQFIKETIDNPIKSLNFPGR